MKTLCVTGQLSLFGLCELQKSDSGSAILRIIGIANEFITFGNFVGLPSSLFLCTQTKCREFAEKRFLIFLVSAISDDRCAFDHEDRGRIA